MLIDSAGRVAIGTTSPTFTDGSGLHIAGSSGALKLQNTTNSNWAYVEYADESNTTKFIQGYRDANGIYGIRPGASLSSTSGISLDSSGKVGIGCTPVRDLQLHTSDSSSELMLSNSTTGATAGSGFMIQQDGNDNYIWNKENSFMSFGTNALDRLRIDSSGRLLIGTTTEGAANEAEDVTIAGTGEVGITLRSTNSGGGRIYFSDGTSGTSEYAGYQIYNHSSNAMIFGTNATERMRINSSGNIGIGKSPVDTNAFSRALDITGTSGAAIYIRTNAPSNSTDYGLLGYFSSDLYLYNKPAGNVRFYTNAQEKMRIDSSGRLLISNTTGVGSYPLQVTAASNAHAICIRGRSQDGIGELRWLSHDGVTPLGEIQYQPDHVNFRCRTGDIRFATGGTTERMRITSSGNVGIGTTNPVVPFVLSHDGNTNLEMGYSAGGSFPSHYLQAYNRGTSAYVPLKVAGSEIVLGSPHEAVRITSGGNLIVGNTSATGFVSSSSQTGVIAFASGALAVNKSSDDVASFNRLVNDGTIVSIRQGGAQEGEIRVSGTAVSYIGGHLARWSQTLTLEEHLDLLKGTVMTNLDEMCEWKNEDNEQLNKMAISTIEGDPNVAGVIVNIDEDDDLNVAMTGDMVIRIAQGTTVARGDLLMSAGDGTAKPQDDDIVRSKTVAKVTSTTVSTTYSDGSYCVPCVLMAC